MPITYKHLFDQDGFTSESINSRFELAMGTGAGVNAITPNDVGVGAFRHDHLPVAIHKAGLSASVLQADNAFTASSTVGLSGTPVTVPASARDKGSAQLVGGIEYPAGLQYKLNMFIPTGGKIGAIIILANACVQNFPLVAPRFISEDTLGINFFIRLTMNPVATIDLDRSMRTTSPRVIISDADGSASVPAFNGLTDLWTNQDVGIRTVARPADFVGSTANIHKIELYAYLVGAETLPPISAAWTALIKKWNLTAIPLHTDYVGMS